MRLLSGRRLLHSSLLQAPGLQTLSRALGIGRLRGLSFRRSRSNMGSAEGPRRRMLPCCPRRADCLTLAWLLYLVRIRIDHELSEERHNQRRSSVSQSASSSSSTSVVNNSCNTTEKPFVGAVIKEEHIVVRLVPLAQFAPATRDKCTYTSEFQGLQYRICQSLRIFDYDASKTNVYWLGVTRQKSCEVFWWFVSRRVSEEEAANICQTSQSVSLRCIRRTPRTYMLGPI